MRSDMITIDNKGNGFSDAVEETRRVASYKKLGEKDTLQLQLCTEEMLSLARSVTGEMVATFWLETEGKQYDLHMSTKTVMDKEKRNLLISAASSRKNEAAGSFLGKLRDTFERAMASDPDHSDSFSTEMMEDLANHDFTLTDAEWDHYEQSVLQKISDDVRISIRGGLVEMTVTKIFK